MPAAVDAIFVEVEFVPGTPVDVTRFVDQSVPIKVKYGRSTPYEVPGPATLDLTLFNDDGRFSPLRATLNDGTPHPYWPSVVPLRLIRYGWIVGATPIVRYTGFVRGWSPAFKDQVRPRVFLHADDRSTVIDKQPSVLAAPLSTELKLDAPDRHYPMVNTFAADDAGKSAIQVIGNVSYLTKTNSASAGKYRGGDPGPNAEDGTVFQFVNVNRASTTSGSDSEYASGNYYAVGDSAPTVSALTIECVVANFLPPQDRNLNYTEPFITLSASGGFNLALQARDEGSGVLPSVIASGFSAPATSASSARLAGIDMFVHVAITWSTSQIRLYLDGQLVASNTFSGSAKTVNTIALGNTTGPSIDLGQVAIFHRILPAARIRAHAMAALAWAGEPLGERIQRVFTAAGYTDDELQIDASTVPLLGGAQTGRNPLDIPRELLETDGAGAAIYVQPDNRIRFMSSSARTSSSVPAFTVDSNADIDGGDWQPAYDLDNAVTTVTVNGPNDAPANDAQAGGATRNVGKYKIRADTITSYALSQTGRKRNTYLAQERIARLAEPGFRLGKVTVDLMTNAGGLAATDIAAALLSSRIRIVNVPRNAGAPAGVLDVIVEGWEENATVGQLTVSYDTSTADMPAQLVWGEPVFGRWQANGHAVGALSPSATTLTITSPTNGAPFTSDPSAYPLEVVIDTERITLPAPSSSSTSPQTFTGVARGADGTIPAAHAAGSLVDLFPTSTWAL